MRCELAVNPIKYTKSRNQKPLPFKGLRFKPELAADTVQIVKKSPLAEFKNYVANWRLYGENFEPTSSNPNSVFMEYFNYRKQICNAAGESEGARIIGRRAEFKVVTSKEPVEYLMQFKNFMQTTSKLATKEQYYEIIDEIAALMPDYVGRYHRSLRPEIKERSGDIFKWRSYLAVETKVGEEVVPTKFFDREKKEEALKNYTEFVENLTGKKVLIGSPSRITIAVDELGLLNDPNSYKDVDYILFGHGKGSSLVTDVEDAATWRFSDSDESVWKFIEENVPRGKRVLVGVCEKDRFYNSDGRFPVERRRQPEMYDNSRKYMFGIGDTVHCDFGREHPAKICESGLRHIIGHSTIERYKGYLTSFIHSTYGKVQNVYYNL